MKRLDGRPAVFFVVFLVAHSASATDLGRCPGTGQDLAEKLWKERQALIVKKFEAKDDAEKPSAWKTKFLDRISFEVAYGDSATLALQEDARSYSIKRGDKELTGGIKYEIPLGAFFGPSATEIRGKDNVQSIELNEQKVEFYDLIYDLRVALAEQDIARQNKGADSAEAALAGLKASKVAVRLHHMTEDKIHFEPECIK
jgi:hypothetical protein